MNDNLKDLIKDYLETHGYDTEQLNDLVDEYESMQDFTEEKDGSFTMVTGNSYDEVSDWIRHKALI